MFKESSKKTILHIQKQNEDMFEHAKPQITTHQKIRNLYVYRKVEHIEQKMLLKNKQNHLSCTGKLSHLSKTDQVKIKNTKGFYCIVLYNRIYIYSTAVVIYCIHFFRT